MSGLEDAACIGWWDLFDSTAPADHRAARKVCLGVEPFEPCPVLAACRQQLTRVQATADWGGPPQGTWAGRLYGSNGKPRRAPEREHGTQRGYDRHRHAGEPACGECRAAHAEYEKKRNRKVA